MNFSRVAGIVSYAVRGESIGGRHRGLCLLLFFSLFSPSFLEGEEEVERDAFAIFKNNCVECHSASKRKGGLLIDSKQSLVKGGDTGAAIEPGNAANSYLVETLFPDADSHMPPKGQLTPKQINSIEKWIDAGAEWDVKRWQELTALKKREVELDEDFPKLYAPIFAMALSPDGKTLAVGFQNQVLLYQVVATEDKKKPVTLELSGQKSGHSDSVQSLAFSPDGKWLASGGYQKLLLHQINQPEAEPKLVQTTLVGRLTAMAFSSDSQKLYIADSISSQGAKLHLYDCEKGNFIRTLESAHDDAIYQLSVSVKGDMIVSASADKLALVRDSQSLEIITSLEGHTSYVLAATFSPNGDQVATGGDDETIKVWDTKTGTQFATFGTRKSGPVGGITWITDPTNLAKREKEKDKEKAEAINTDRIVAINDLGQPGTFTDLNQHEGGQRSTGAKEKRHDAINEALTAMAFDKKQLYLFAGTESGKLYIWDQAGKKIGELDIAKNDE